MLGLGVRLTSSSRGVAQLLPVWILNEDVEPLSTRIYRWSDGVVWEDDNIWKDLTAWIFNSDLEEPGSNNAYVWDDFAVISDDNNWKDGSLSIL